MATSVRPTATPDDGDFSLPAPPDDYAVRAALPIAVALERAEPVELKRLAALADKLGADAVILLGEMPERMIPADPDSPLPTTGRYSAAAFVSFDDTEGTQANPAVPSVWHRHRRPHARRHLAARLAKR